MTINYEVLEVEKYKHHTGPESDHNTMGIKSLKLPCATLFFLATSFGSELLDLCMTIL